MLNCEVTATCPVIKECLEVAFAPLNFVLQVSCLNSVRNAAKLACLINASKCRVKIVVL